MASVLSSTTAPGKVFTSRSELADHYKSDWHKYNLKRREAGLPLLEETEFQARWQAALALKREKDQSQHQQRRHRSGKGGGTAHLKNKNSKSSNKKNKTTATTANGNPDGPSNRVAPRPTQESLQQSMDEDDSDDDNNDDDDDEDGDDDAPTAKDTTVDATKTKRRPAALIASQENPEIDPKQCLFDAHRSGTLEENVEYMHRTYGFFIPDQECLVDQEGLLGYLHEKIKLGHYCLYCEKVFPTWQGCQQHMINKQHSKLRYEPGYWDELEPFFDFAQDNDEFLATAALAATKNAKAGNQAETDADAGMRVDLDEEEDGWEDIDEGEEDDHDEEMANKDVDDDDDEVYQGYEQEIARFGLDVTDLGELIFPDGRVVGHRALRRYYKQRVRPANTSTAVVAAQQAAGERLYQGQVINLRHQHPLPAKGILGAGKGILVSLSKDGGGPAQFSALSLYRYRAAVHKQRRGDEKGKRLQEKAFQNINRMDKKHNRLMNGVSVAHAAR